MRVTVLAAVLVVGALMLASCTTPNMTTNTASTDQQASNTTTQREAPVPPALRTPRQRSAVGWPDLGYQPRGRY
jgi:hypothetical protein